MKFRGLASFGLAGILSGCVQSTGNELHPDEGGNSNYSTILVQNESLEPIHPRTDYRSLLGVVGVGENKCLKLPNNGFEISIYFESEGRNYQTRIFSPQSSSTGGWYLRVGRTPWLDILSLEPANRCVVGKTYRKVRER